jgi:MarR family transcriptional regulator, organic hydroperoxide resistance regulator
MEFPPSHSGLEYILAHIFQDFMQFMRQTGLSTPQITALLYIFHSPNGECGLSEIGDLTDASKPAVSQLVERLVQRGLVERAEDPQDRRNTKLRLTDKSRKLIQDVITSNHFLMDLMTSLPAKQRETVHAAFGYLAQAGQQIQSSHTQKERKHA